MPPSLFTRELLRWYALHGRTLPWRGLMDPYPVWVSEIILQQTRIAQGTAYWQRFMQRFPTLRELASATEDEVLRLWEGLGYYSRARNLHAAARQVMAQWGGVFPRTLQGIRSLRGIGDYTAAAIASLCFGVDAAALDGNGYRVLSRHFGVDIPVDSAEGKKAFASLAAHLLPQGEAGTFNQALMDFGALQCTPRNPLCEDCPLRGSCAAWREGRVTLLPAKRPAKPVRERHLTYIYIRTAQGETPIRQRGSGDIWQGLWEPFCVEQTLPTPGDSSSAGKEDKDATGTPPGTGAAVRNASPHTENKCEESLPPALRQELVSLGKPLRHALTHQTLVAQCFLLETPRRIPLPEGYRWVREQDLSAYAKPRLFTHLLEMLESTL